MTIDLTRRPVVLAALLAACLSPAVPAADPVVEWYDDTVGGWVSATDSLSRLATGDLERTSHYEPDGTLRWSHVFSIPTGHTLLHGLVVDSQDHVIRGGYLEGPGDGYLVVKYDTDGQLLWSTVADIAFNEQAIRLGVDASDNLYLFGEADQAPVTKRWLTVKFSPSGQVLWHRWGAYAEPVAMAVRGEQVVVTGEANGGDFVTTSYALDGTTRWDASYQPGSSGSNHVAIGPDGQVAVCGWGQSGLAPGSAGTVVLYDTTGRQLWAAEYNGPYGGIEIFKRVAIDSRGDVVTTGYGLSSVPSDAWSTVKFDATGALVWARLYDNASFTGWEEGRALTLGPDDAVHVGGLSQRLGPCGGFGNLEGHVVKYDADGALLWAERLACGSDPRRILLDPSGGLYAVAQGQVLRLREPFAQLGGGLAGTTGTPSLVGGGELSAGSAVSLSLSGALPSAPAFLLLSTAALYAPFKGGVLIPDPAPPAGVVTTAATDAGGSLTLAGTWPAGIPAGALVYVQTWVADAGAALGFSASNAVVSATH